MKSSAEVVITGGGIMGACTAFYLTRMGVRDVVLLERQGLAAGSTGKSAALVRVHYSNPVTVRMALRSREVFRDFTHVVGGDPVFRQTGWLFLVPPDKLEAMRLNAAMLVEQGVDMEILQPEQIPDILPGANVSDVAAACYEPGSGYADPVKATEGFARAAERAGAAVYLNTPATRVLAENGRVSGVETEKGRIAARVVVDAAGPWARKVAATAGIDLPLVFPREQEAMFETNPAYLRHMPAVSDAAGAVYFRHAGEGRLLIGQGYPKPYEHVDPDGPYKETSDDDFKAAVAQKLFHRLPRLKGSPLVGSWIGLYSVTPDWHPILGPVPGLDNFYGAVGGSGHSFKLGPAIGQMMAESIVNGGPSTTEDIAFFRATRFAEGKPITAAYGGNRA